MVSVELMQHYTYFHIFPPPSPLNAFYLKENGADMCTSGGCSIDIQVNHDGQVLSGTNTVMVE
jgi:hypothetical protein